MRIDYFLGIAGPTKLQSQVLRQSILFSQWRGKQMWDWMTETLPNGLVYLVVQQTLPRISYLSGLLVKPLGLDSSFGLRHSNDCGFSTTGPKAPSPHPFFLSIPSSKEDLNDLQHKSLIVLQQKRIYSGECMS